MKVLDFSDIEDQRGSHEVISLLFGKTSPEKEDKFIEEYESLKAELAEDEAIVFMDAVHPTQATKVAWC